MKNPNPVLLVASLVTALLMASSVVAQQNSGAAAASVSAGSGSSSVVPRLVTYSGVLKDASGRPVAGVTGVTFLLYRDVQGGAPVWMETHCNWFIGRDGERLNANGGPVRKKKEIDWKGGGARVGRKRGHRGDPSGH